MRQCKRAQQQQHQRFVHEELLIAAQFVWVPLLVQQCSGAYTMVRRPCMMACGWVVPPVMLCSRQPPTGTCATLLHKKTAHDTTQFATWCMPCPNKPEGCVSAGPDSASCCLPLIQQQHDVLSAPSPCAQVVHHQPGPCLALWAMRARAAGCGPQTALVKYPCLLVLPQVLGMLC